MRRGVGLIHFIGGLFVSGVVLSICVPLYLTGLRQADAGILRARMREEARQISNHFREDVRQAASVSIASNGSGVRLLASRPGGRRSEVRYQLAKAGLTREVSGSDEARDAWAAPLTGVRFTRAGRSVRLQLFFDQQLYGHRQAFSTECAAVPRSAL
jgi:hypothetical protein